MCKCQQNGHQQSQHNTKTHESTGNVAQKQALKRYERICMNLQAWSVIIEYSSTYFSLQVDPGHCFHPTSPEGFTDERKEQLKVLKWVGFRTHIAHISFTS